MKPTNIRAAIAPASSARRRLLVAGAAACGLWTAALPVWAQADFPNHPIKFVVPYSAGSGSDALARTIAQGITEKTGKPVIVENRDGAGSLIGTMAVAKAPPDGYTILMAANPLVIVPAGQAQPQYNPTKDFVPVAKVGVIPLVLAVTPSLGFKSVRDLIAYAKANPRKLNYGSSGPGTSSQQVMEIFKQAVGIDVVEVPYKSTAQAMTDLIGGTLAVFPVVVPLVSSHLQAGKAIALAVFDTQRSPSLPNVPAVTEEVHARGYVPTPVWYGFVAPAGTPAPIVATLSKMINAAMDTEEVKVRLATLGARRINVSNEQFAADLKAEFEAAHALAKRLGTTN